MKAGTDSPFLRVLRVPLSQLSLRSKKGWRVIFVAVVSGILLAYNSMKPPRYVTPQKNKGDSPSLEDVKTNDIGSTSSAHVDVSVIILTYKKHEALAKLLPSVMHQSSSEYKFEIIIADNGCLAETERTIQHAFNNEALQPQFIKLCNNPGYSAGNNAAVMLAAPTSRYFLFLNDDIVLTRPTFIQNLLHLAEEKLDAVAVGCKLVDAAGKKLIEAGSMIFQDGSAAGYGRDKKPYEDEYSYPRPVDYVSGACLLVERGTFEGYVHENGDFGFHGSMFPNYYEDTDLQLHFQHDLKKEVWFQPKAVARHEEHGSFGTDESVKKMQAAQKLFFNKWKKSLKSHLEIAKVKSVTEREMVLTQGADRRARDPNVANILYIDSLPPNKARGSGYGRAFDNLSMIAELGHKVTLVATESNPDWCDPECIEKLRGMGIEFIGHFHFTPKQILEQRLGFYDIVLVSRPHTLIRMHMDLQDAYTNSPFTLAYDCEALTFRRLELLRKLVEEDGIDFPGKKFLKGMGQLGRTDELTLIDSADAVISVSDAEREVIASMAKDAKKVYAIGHIMGTKPVMPDSFEGRRGVLFIAAFHDHMYYNGDAIWYFLKEVYPLVVEESGGDIPLTVAGRKIPKELRRAVAGDKSISSHVTFLESPPTIWGLYSEARVFIAPHLYGAGIQYKVSECLSAGLPVAMSDFTHKSFKDAPGCVGSTPTKFRDCVISIHDDEKRWKELRRKGMEFIAETHSRNGVMKQWSGIINAGLKLANKRKATFRKGKLPPSPMQLVTRADPLFLPEDQKV